jgi:hypothetical protein
VPAEPRPSGSGLDARYGIARTDLPHLTRHLSDLADRGLADRGLTDVADLGWSYPLSRYDAHDWHAELHRAADDLRRFVDPPHAPWHTPSDRHRDTTTAQHAWGWIADNLDDLWD